MGHNYWEKRMLDGGHTGWRDPVIYAFDQKIRVNLVKAIIEADCVDIFSDLILLDFGCGSGDFSVELSSFFKKIYLYDISDIVTNSAAKRIFNGEAISSLDNLLNIHVTLNTIICVTVLQHIIDDEELKKVLSFMQTNLAEDGIFVCIESFQNEVDNGIQRKWSCLDFEKILTMQGFSIVRKNDYYYPDTSNEKYYKYSNRIDVKILRRIHNMLGAQGKKLVLKLMGLIADRYNSNLDDFLYDYSRKSGTKVYVLKKMA